MGLPFPLTSALPFPSLLFIPPEFSTLGPLGAMPVGGSFHVLRAWGCLGKEACQSCLPAALSQPVLFIPLLGVVQGKPQSFL